MAAQQQGQHLCDFLAFLLRAQETHSQVQPTQSPSRQQKGKDGPASFVPSTRKAVSLANRHLTPSAGSLGKEERGWDWMPSLHQHALPPSKRDRFPGYLTHAPFGTQTILALRNLVSRTSTQPCKNHPMVIITTFCCVSPNFFFLIYWAALG